MKVKTRKDHQKRRHMRIRKKVLGTAERPRLCVSFSNKHLYIQFIDDDAGETLVAYSSTGVKDQPVSNNQEAAKVAGEKIALVAKEKGIKAVRFDRGGHKYHGRVKAVAEAAREAGLEL